MISGRSGGGPDDDVEDLSGLTFTTGRSGRMGRLEKFLGAGGQGAVYDATLNGTHFAIKWYHPSYISIDLGLRPRLSRAIAQGAPNDAFLWPIDLVEVAGQPSFGYLMRLRDPDYVGMKCLICRPPQRVDPSLTVRAIICWNIAQSFLELHAKGFCYQDVNFGNIFFHPVTGDILICDNDNVDVDGSPASVYGTRKFMAPEIVRREAMPSTKTDLFSMTVLFFYVLHSWHPLDGKREAAIACMDSAAETSLYGTNPVFLFDPVNTSNGPLAGMHEPIEARWKSLPSGLRDLFVRALTIGLSRPGDRVQEAEWCTAFTTLATSVYACPQCGWENTIEQTPLNVPPGTRACIGCGSRICEPAVMTIGRRRVSLAQGMHIPAHVLRPGTQPDISALAASVEVHPQRPGVLGLRNRSGETWRTRLRDSSEVAVPPGSTVRIVDGASIDFGGARGLIATPASEDPGKGTP